MKKNIHGILIYLIDYGCFQKRELEEERTKTARAQVRLAELEKAIALAKEKLNITEDDDATGGDNELLASVFQLLPEWATPRSFDKSRRKASGLGE